jgi:enoyl-CoA hydratase
MSVHIHTQDRVTTVLIDRPHARNAVDGPTAVALHRAFVAFDADPQADVAVLAGSGGTFCAGADLKALADGIGSESRANPLNTDMQAVGPMGPTRLQLRKPVIAAVSGYAVAGGLAHDAAMTQEFAKGLPTLHSREGTAGAARFSAGAGRHGAFGS